MSFGREFQILVLEKQRLTSEIKRALCSFGQVRFQATTNFTKQSSVGQVYRGAGVCNGRNQFEVSQPW